MKKTIIIILLPLVAGCLGHKTLDVDQATLHTLKDKTLSLVIHESPDFMAMTSDRSMFSTTDVDAAYEFGNQLIQKYRIKDPAENICKMTAKILSANYGLLYNESSLIKSKSKKMQNLVHLANEKDYLLDIDTIYWFFLNKEFNIPDYFIRYVVKIRLIDVNKAKSIGQSSCDYDTASVGKPLVSYEKLIENDAAYIKQTLNEASTFCVNKFKNELL